MKQLVLIYLAAVMLASCSGGSGADDPDHPYRAEIDSLKKWKGQLEGLGSDLKKIDLELIDSAGQVYDYQVRMLKTYYNPDSVDQQFASIMNGYKKIIQPAKTRSEVRQLDTNLSFTLKNMTALIDKMEKQDFDDSEDPDAFYNAERKAAGKLMQQIELTVMNTEKSLEVFHRLSPEVDKVVSTLDTTAAE